MCSVPLRENRGIVIDESQCIIIFLRFSATTTGASHEKNITKSIVHRSPPPTTRPTHRSCYLMRFRGWRIMPGGASYKPMRRLEFLRNINRRKHQAVGDVAGQCNKFDSGRQQLLIIINFPGLRYATGTPTNTGCPWESTTRPPFVAPGTNGTSAAAIQNEFVSFVSPAIKK